jgi:AcrR family transcriptional regulator
MATVEHILIVGGGIAGLTLATALHQQGFQPQPVDRSPEWPAVGAGIMLQGNGLRVLRSLGLAAAVEQAGAVVRHWAWCDQQGELLSDTDLVEVWGEVGTCVGIARPTLRQALTAFAAPLTCAIFMCITIHMKSRRSYTMRARADSASATRQRILDAATALLKARLRSDIHLDTVAAAAQVSVQTIMRIFGSRTALLEEAGQQVIQHISQQRDRAAPGDITGAIAGLFVHYEEVGDIVIRNLAQEDDPAVQPGLRMGRVEHRRWVERHFGPQLARHDAATRDQLVDALVCVCDVYTWKRLRRDMPRSREDAESTMILMVTALLGEE